MFRATVDQKPTMPVSEGTKKTKNSPKVWNLPGELSTYEDRERNAVFGAGVCVEQHGHEDDQIPQQDSADGLPPVHTAGDQARGEHVGGDANAHGDPERGVTVDSPSPAMEGYGSE